MRWDYLDDDAYRARYPLAAWFLRDCRHVIEIGGYHLDLGDFAAPGQRVTVLGPDVDEDRRSPNVERLRGCFPCEPRLCIPPHYGLCVLGMQFEMDSSDWPLFENLARNASRCVFEAVADYPIGAEHLARMLAACRHRPVQAELRIEVVTPVYPMTAESWPSRPYRRLVCV